MQVLTIKVDSVGQNEQAVADFSVQQLKGETWNVMRNISVISGTAEAERKIVLQDDERLVVTGKVTKVAVMDPVQNVVKMVDKDPDVRAAQQASEAAVNEANRLSQERLEEARKLALVDTTQKTNLGNPVPKQPTVPSDKPVLGPAGGPAPSDAPIAVPAQSPNPAPPVPKVGEVVKP